MFGRDRDDFARGVYDLTLSAIRDHPEFRTAFIGGDERNAVFARPHASQQIGLHVLEETGIPSARHPGRRHHEDFGAAVDQRASDRRDAAVCAHERAQHPNRGLHRCDAVAGFEPSPVEMPEKEFVGAAGHRAVAIDNQRGVARLLTPSGGDACDEDGSGSARQIAQGLDGGFDREPRSTGSLPST